jgi:hypothetical protein
MGRSMMWTGSGIVSKRDRGFQVKGARAKERWTGAEREVAPVAIKAFKKVQVDG